MEEILHNIPYVSIYMLSGPTEAEHLKTLAVVLQRLEDHGLKLKKSKSPIFEK